MTDLDLALTYMPRPARLRVQALFDLDAALGDVVRTSTDPMLGRIRLAWWRERLLELADGGIRGEPVLEQLAIVVGEGRVLAEPLAALVDTWEPLLEPFPWDDHDVIGPMAGRGAGLFGQSALLLDASIEEATVAMVAGTAWATVDLLRNCSDPDTRDLIVSYMQDFGLDKLTGVAPSVVRPLTMLGVLAKRDIRQWPQVEPPATPARAWAMISHKLTGKL